MLTRTALLKARVSGNIRNVRFERNWSNNVPGRLRSRPSKAVFPFWAATVARFAADLQAVQAIIYQGLENSPLGGSSLAVQGNQLILGNLGSSGQDGVSIALPTGLTGLETHWLNPDAGDALPAGAFVRQQVI